MGCSGSRDPSAQQNPVADAVADPGAAPISTSTDGAREAAATAELKISTDILSTISANPNMVTSSAMQASVSSIGEIFRGVRPQIRLTFPIELVGRCVMNRMITVTAGTDLGNVVSSLMKDDLSEIKEGVNVLRSAPLKTSADELKALLHTVPLLKDMEGGPSLDAEITKFVVRAATVVHDANTAFHTVATLGEKIRAVVIACAAIQASAVGTVGKASAAIVRANLGSQLTKLFSLPGVLRDIVNHGSTS